MNRKCKICYKVKDIEQFVEHKLCKYGRGHRCKQCKKEYNKIYHQTKSIDDRTKRRSFLTLLKKNGCNFCEEKEPICIDFHHLKDKDFVVSQFGNRNELLIIQELRKCALLCSNCHRKLHAKIINKKPKVLTEKEIANAVNESFGYKMLIV